uniref:Uncharacterized protein n=1 Tax=Arundo donax TaxID=35708 RepID=A0A0A8YLT7_ARUDO
MSFLLLYLRLDFSFVGRIQQLNLVFHVLVPSPKLALVNRH